MKLFDSSLTPEEQQLAWYVDREVVLEDVSKPRFRTFTIE